MPAVKISWPFKNIFLHFYKIAAARSVRVHYRISQRGFPPEAARDSLRDRDFKKKCD